MTLASIVQYILYVNIPTNPPNEPRYDNAIVRQETSGYDFHVTSDASSKDVCFQLSLHGHPACVTPVDIGSFVVSHLLAVARGYLHHDQITSAVIAVPADFDATRKAATIEAFHRAGIRVTRVLEEPTAAAVAYGLHKDPAVTYVLVFDFGGGTLDVSLLYIVNESVQLLGSAGDNQLGGSDLDSALSQHLNDVFRDKLGQVILAHHDPNEHDDHDMEPCTTGGIRVIAERLKRTLSHEHKAEATCQLGGQQVTMTMTRLEFETLCQKLLDRTMLPVFQVLEENQMRPDAVDEVVLVGGSSRIPWIQERLTQVFGKSPKNTINPDLAVAYGAARIVD